MTLESVFDQKTIDYLKSNQSEITEELLETLREQGNKGKQLALEILDMDKDEEQYYLDAFGNRISQNGNRSIKKKLKSVLMISIILKIIM
jgi:hypothetical protein